MLDEQTKATRPMTGDEYIESSKGRREVRVHGERIRDVPRFHDALCDGEKESLACPGRGG